MKKQCGTSRPGQWRNEKISPSRWRLTLFLIYQCFSQYSPTLRLAAKATSEKHEDQRIGSSIPPLRLLTALLVKGAETGVGSKWWHGSVYSHYIQRLRHVPAEVSTPAWAPKEDKKEIWQVLNDLRRESFRSHTFRVFALQAARYGSQAWPEVEKELLSTVTRSKKARVQKAHTTRFSDSCELRSSRRDIKRGSLSSTRTLYFSIVWPGTWGRGVHFIALVCFNQKLQRLVADCFHCSLQGLGGVLFCGSIVTYTTKVIPFVCSVLSLVWHQHVKGTGLAVMAPVTLWLICIASCLTCSRGKMLQAENAKAFWDLVISMK